MPLILHLQGGLGNQLFQYATAKALAIHNQTDLILDDSWFSRVPKNQTARQFLLHDLSISEKKVTHRPNLSTNKFLHKMGLFFPRPHETILHNVNPYLYDDSIFVSPLKPNHNYFLIGYWQSFKYFDHIRAQIQLEFQPRYPLSPHYKAYLTEIRSSSSIMLHIRRGDYVNLKSASSMHGAIDLAYYLTSMQQMLERDTQSHFFIFSDDIEWARAHLPNKYKLTFIHSELRPNAVIDELFLMAQCRHYIIANSSLSWWGAWLSDANEAKRVIAPSKWLNKKKFDLGHLIPESWDIN